jgi:hypothetical protein
MIFPATGRCSWFGGPNDQGVGANEGLALVERADLQEWWFSRCFALQPGFGLARGLNPNAYYCAMVWDYSQYPREVIRRSIVRVSANGKSVLAQPVDFGPGDGSIVDGQQTENTGRLIDLSPGILAELGLQTDDEVTVDLIPG